MIVSFGSKQTRQIWEGKPVRGLPLEIQHLGRRKLIMLDSSDTLNDLKIPPSNRLEKLSGKLNSLYSIRINRQWRIVFQWTKGIASDVQILDYH